MATVGTTTVTFSHSQGGCCPLLDYIKQNNTLYMYIVPLY